MGNLVSHRVYGRVVGHALVIGLDGAGKTALSYGLDPDQPTEQTIGFNHLSAVDVNGIRLTIFDVGGDKRIRPLWSHYFVTNEHTMFNSRTTALILFVIDRTQPRLEEAREALMYALSWRGATDVPLALLCTKSDRPEAMDVQEIVNFFQGSPAGAAEHAEACLQHFGLPKPLALIISKLAFTNDGSTLPDWLVWRAFAVESTGRKGLDEVLQWACTTGGVRLAQQSCWR